MIQYEKLLRRSKSFKVTDFGTNRKPICDLLLVINSNLPPILHRFRDIALEMSKIAIFDYPYSAYSSPWDDLRKIFTGHLVTGALEFTKAKKTGHRVTQTSQSA